MKVRDLGDDRFLIMVEGDDVSVIELKAVQTEHHIVWRTGDFESVVPPNEPIRIAADPELGFCVLGSAEDDEREALFNNRLEANLRFSGPSGGAYQIELGHERVIVEQTAGDLAKTLVLDFSALEGDPTTEPE